MEPPEVEEPLPEPPDVEVVASNSAEVEPPPDEPPVEVPPVEVPPPEPVEVEPPAKMRMALSV